MQPSATAERAAHQRMQLDSTMSPRRPRKQPEHYARLTPSDAISSNSGLEVEANNTADSESDTSGDSDVSNQGPGAGSSDDDKTQERPGPRRKRRSTAAAEAVQPATKKVKGAQPEAPRTASSGQGRWRKGGGHTSRVIALPDGGKAIEMEITAFASRQSFYVPSAFGFQCFPNPPYDVHLKVIVDDQQADLGAASGKIRRYTDSSGRTQYTLFYKTGLWNSYTGHMLTKISTNSSSSELTFHLMSPARQQASTVAEAAAIAAAATQSGQCDWLEQQGTGRTLESKGRVYLPLPLLQKVFRPALLTLPAPGSDPDTPVKVVVAIYKNNELASRTYQSLINRQRRMILVPLEVRQQLAGFKLVRFRAAKPNLLEVYFSSGDNQEPAAVPVAPVPPSASPCQSAAAPSNNPQAGTSAAGCAASRMPSAMTALAEQRAPPTPRAHVASAIAAAHAQSSGGRPRLCDGGFAAGRSDAAAASSADNQAEAEATAGALGNTSSMQHNELAAAGATPKPAAVAAGVAGSSSSARAIGLERVAAASRPGTLAAITTTQQTLTQLHNSRKQVQKNVRFDSPAANHGIVPAGNKEAGTGFDSNSRPELNTPTAVAAAAAAAANTSASKSPVVAAGLQTPPTSAPTGRAELHSTAARRASRDVVQGSTARSSTKHRAKSVLQEQQRLGMQQRTGTPAATGMIDLTISSGEETDRLPDCHTLKNAVPGSVSQRKSKHNHVYTSSNTGVTQPCSVQQSPAPWKQSAAAAGTAPVARTVPAAPRPGLCATAAVKTEPAAPTATPETELAATASASAAPATLGLKVETVQAVQSSQTPHWSIHSAVHNPTRSMPVQTATAANDRTRSAGLPAGFSLEPFRSVPLAFQQLVLLLEVLAAPDQLLQQLQTAAQAMRRAKGTNGWPERLEELKMHYSIVQAHVRRGTADLALTSVGVLLDEASQ